jgi:2-methylcitrate dehydratase PrpD
MRRLGGPLHPQTLIDMAHSPAYFAAAGVADQTFSWQHAGMAKIADPAIHRLIDRVRLEPTQADPRFRQGATIIIHTRDGRTLSNTVHVPRGAATLGIAWNDVDAKYRALSVVAGLDRQKVEASLQQIHDFRTTPNVVTLLRTLEAV